MNPYMLQTIEVMNLLINSTNTTAENKRMAENIISRLLKEIDKTTLEITASNLGLI
jgi:hypothetical protein